MRKALFLLLLLFAFSLPAQTVISGQVTGTDGKTVVGAVVKLTSAGRTRAFSRTGSTGEFRIKVPASVTGADTDSLTFSHISYENASMPYRADRTVYDVRMLTRSKALAEVVFVAPSVKQRGDTLSFDLGSFTGKEDVTLEDALKKIPGITVEKSGAIKYLGKDISKFYIEGLDMLGGKYALATRNVPADYVASVEVIENHKERKIDRDTYSDNVALNIRLKNKVKFKPMGTSEALIGYEDSKVLYRIGATGMMFNPQFQSIISAKYGNDSEFAFNTIYDLYEYSREAGGNLAASASGSLGSSSPPLSSGRYVSSRDLLTSINAIKKTGKDSDLKANADYAYEHMTYGYGTERTYFAGADEIKVKEIQSPSKRHHRPSLQINFNTDGDNLYFRERFKIMADFTYRDYLTDTDGSLLTQDKDQRSITAENNLSWSIRRGAQKWHINSDMKYVSSPENTLSIIPGSGTQEASAVQKASSDCFIISNTAATTFVRPFGNINIPFGLRYMYSDLHTELFSDNQKFTNRIYSNSYILSFSPGYEYISPSRRYEVSVWMPVKLSWLDAKNSATDRDIDKLKVLISPSAKFNCQVSPSTRLLLSGSYSNTIGDAMNLLTAPIMNSYRNVSTRSGILAENRSGNVTLGVEFKKPLDFWFADARVSYTDSRYNLLNSQTVDPDHNITGAIASENASNSVSANGKIVKNIQSIRSKFTLSGSFTWQKSNMMQQGDLIPFYGRTYSINPHINIAPLTWISLDYGAGYSKSMNSYLGRSSSFDMLTQNVRLLLFPFSGMELSASLEHVRKEITENTYKSISLLDVKALYKFKKLYRVSLAVNNILNNRSYSYTVFNGLDTYSYDYTLRPRQITLSFSITM